MTTTMDDSPAIGIDLGTTYSCVGIFRNDRVEIIQNDHTNRITPSMVAFTDTQRVVGDKVKLLQTIDPANTVYDAKRLIGRRFDDPTIQQDIARWPFKVVDEDGKPAIKVKYKGEDKTFFPEEISAMILEKMKSMAEQYLEKTVTKAVITVPAYFNDAQRNATKDAGRIAGLDVLRIINEPTAAGYCYGLNKLHEKDRNVMIYDLGGGTFDVSILNINDGVFKVIATAGDTHLGGSDFDNILVDHCVGQFKKKHGKDMTSNNRAMRRLRAACERAKEFLSTLDETTIELEYLFDQTDFYITLTRALFERLCDSLFQNTMETVEKTLEDAKMDSSKIDNVVLVGGSTKIPRIQQLLKDHFGSAKLKQSLNQDLAVASGAAIQAAILNGDNSEAIRDLLLCDVVPLSLGIEVGFDYEMSTVIPRNTTIPVKKSKTFVTSEDKQTVVTFQVFEGERVLTTDNNKLGQFKIIGVPPAPKGNERFDVTFDVDVNGILNVTAKNISTGRQNQITICNNGRLSKSVISRMIKDAERYRDEDKQHRERITAKNTLERFVFRVQCDMRKVQINNKADRYRVEDKVTQITKMLDSEGGTKLDMDKLRDELETIYNSAIDSNSTNLKKTISSVD